MQARDRRQIDIHLVVSSSYKIARAALLLAAGSGIFFGGRMIFDSFYALLGFSILFVCLIAYLSLLALLKTYTVYFPGAKRHRATLVMRRRMRAIILKAVVFACSGGLMTIWLWADIVDGLFAALFVILAHWYRKRFLNPRHIHGWIVVFLTVGFVFLVNCDKVAEYPHYGKEWYYFAEWLCWAFIVCYPIHIALRIRPRPWKWLAAALLIWLLPITEVPGEIARQFVGWSLTGRIENLYFTKIRPDRVYALELCPRQIWVEVFRKTKLSYQYDTKEVLMDGGGISGWVQIPRTPVLFLKLRASLEGN